MTNYEAYNHNPEQYDTAKWNKLAKEVPFKPKDEKKEIPSSETPLSEKSKQTPGVLSPEKQSLETKVGAIIESLDAADIDSLAISYSHIMKLLYKSDENKELVQTLEGTSEYKYAQALALYDSGKKLTRKIESDLEAWKTVLEKESSGGFFGRLLKRKKLAEIESRIREKETSLRAQEEIVKRSRERLIRMKEDYTEKADFSATKLLEIPIE